MAGQQPGERTPGARRAVSGGASRGGQRAREHRAGNVWSALGITALGLLLPGTGRLFAGRRPLGMAVLACWLLLVAGLVWYALHPRHFLALVVDPTDLLLMTVLLGALIVGWCAVLIDTYHLVRPERLASVRRVVGRVGVGLLCLVVAAPLAVGMRYAMVQRDLVTTVFAGEASQTRPHADPSNPWQGTDRVNVLLLGGDGGVDREGIRTDSMIVASMDTGSGDTELFSVPRNLMNAPFPENSRLHDVYPNGFTGEGDPGEWMLNAVYRNVPAQHPGILGKSDNEGADALKLALTGVLGIRVDYYLLVNLAGFEKIVDAIGGVTVNINQPIPIGGDTDRGIPPKDYLEPGPNRRLDGFHALWFSRGRYGLDDYNRMERQRCMTQALIDEADPITLLRRYQALAEAGKKIVRTDIPQNMLQAFVGLTLRVKDADVESVVFRPSEHFVPADPDFDWIHKTVRKAIGEDRASKNQGQKPDRGSSPKPRKDKRPSEPTDPCAYNPVG